ncbi:MAG TPA: L-histidine N(alpha)-methyltransferase [Spongiibacteraceae bacterium]|nr:L-histidine N(alpha)-methyltransferase [Spongiibacteraceae bacterium]
MTSNKPASALDTGTLDTDTLATHIQKHPYQTLIDGLTAARRHIDPKYFYDHRGSGLFEQITRLPEYYPTRTERQILHDACDEIGHCAGRGRLLIEPGAGACKKVRALLNALRPAAYVPMDISAEHLQQAAAELDRDFSWLRVMPLALDHSQPFTLPPGLPDAPRLLFYPGSTIGNLSPEQARQFLVRLRQIAGAEGGLLIGVDLDKNPRILSAAYNDASGVTAAFNRNILNHVNHLLSANFDPDAFLHHAFYNEAQHRIEMHLVSRRPQRVRFEGGELTFMRGDSIHTENSYKYTLDSFEALAASAGWQRASHWLDGERLFSVQYFRAAAADRLTSDA